MGCELVGLLLALTYCGCTLAVRSCDPHTIVQYKVTFQGLWTKATFPKVYPELRPKAEWSPIIGRSHSSAYKLFTVGSLVSSKLQTFVEYGDSSKLVEEGQGHSQILDSFSSQPLHYGHGITETQLFSDSSRHKVSLVAKIVPSPDWFVGIDSFSLCQEGHWIEGAQFDLYPMDAGSQQGYTFSSPKWRSDPQEVIHEITSTFPNRTADAFYYPYLKALPPIARASFSRTRVYQVDVSLKSAVDNSAITAQHKQDKYVAPSIGANIVKPPVLLLQRNLTLEYRRTSSTSTPMEHTTPTETATPAEHTMPKEHTTPAEDTTPIVHSQYTTAEKSVTLNQKIQGILDEVMRGQATTTFPATIATALKSATKWFGLRATRSTPRILYVTQSRDMQDDEDTVYSETEGSGMVEATENVVGTEAPARHRYQSNKLFPSNDPDSVFGEKVCQVSEWSEWSACTRTCGYGMKARSRQVIRWTGNVPCPELKMEQLCGSMKKCNWNHFSLKFNSTQSIFGNQKRIRQKKVKSDMGATNVTGGALTGSTGSFKRRFKVRKQS